MNLKIVHTKDGRTLYKDLDTGHWVNKKNVPSDVLSKANKPLETPQKQSSDIRDPEKDEQIKKREAEAKRLNQPKTVENKYGFEITNEDALEEAPPVEYTDSYWKKMADLKKLKQSGYDDPFRDTVLAGTVDDKMYAIGDDATDEQIRLWYKLQDDITDDEYWATYHALADELGIKTPKYVPGDSDPDSLSSGQAFGTIEEAQKYAEKNGYTHIYDRFTGKTLKGKKK